MNKEVQVLRHLWDDLNKSVFGGKLLCKPLFKVFESEIFAGWFESRGGVPEIWINVRYFKDFGLGGLIDTMHHEMVHQLQYETGRPLRHDKFFKKQMCSEPSKCHLGSCV